MSRSRLAAFSISLGSIFVSYRRGDVAGDAGRLTDHLRKYFGKRRIFLDIDSIASGTDFEQALDAALVNTAVMVVVIGPRWTSLCDVNGLRRLDDPEDFVVREVAAALRLDIPVIPVLMQGATLPTAGELPESIASLAKRQHEQIDHAEFNDDVRRLCARLTKDVVRDVWLWLATGLVAALVVGVFVYGPLRTADVDPPGSITAAPRPTLLPQ